MSDSESNLKPKPSPYILGIDLGTTNSSVAIYTRGTPVVIPLEGAMPFQGNTLFPSVINIDSHGEIKAGNDAKKRLLILPDDTVASAKRCIGKTPAELAREFPSESWPKVFKNLPGRSFMPQDIAAEILTRLIANLQPDQINLDLQGNPKQVVICIPANFNDAQKNATLEAARLADLEVLYLLEEPVAAAIAYGLEQARDQTILVYDLGGGTFDVAILKVDSTQKKQAEFKVLAKEGISKLGGDDFDYEVIKIAAQKLQATSSIDILDLNKDQGISKKNLRQAQQKLKEAAEEAKKELSQAQTAHLAVPNIIKDESGNVYNLELEITREEFEAAIRPMVLQSKQAVDQALASAQLGIEDIDRIILVGGSTRVPLIRSMISEMFDKEPYGNINPDTAVACGAAIYGSSKSAVVRDGETVEDTVEQQPIIKNIVTHYLGIELIDFQFSCLLEKGQEIPLDGTLKQMNIYQTPRDNMTEIRIAVYQSDQLVEFVRSSEVNVVCIGEFIFGPIPARPAGEEKIEVTFEIDQQNLLRVTARGSSAEGNLEIQRK